MAIETPEHVIAVLETAPRHGAEVDEPEGARYVKLSETMVDRMITALIEVTNAKDTD